MVTFSIPGDDDAPEVATSTPKPRPPLPFSKRAFATSPFAGGATRRNGTTQTAPPRKSMLGTRDDIPSSNLRNSSIATAQNIFRASAFSDSPASTSFSPSLPHSAVKKVFAPGATPEPTRAFRQSTAQATPRGMASIATDKELFAMRIPSPPPELTGEVLTGKVPKDWNSKGSIYADQFLAHLCPPGLDEEQRRQFFCILDLRRLKYAANDIFFRKDWKLNVINFAKEFEKSRSIILLRYGLYEFQNVKPSKEVLKRWRREHGLPDPEEDEAESTPSKTATSAKKRKASDDISKGSAAAGGSTPKGKRRAMEEETVVTPAPSKNKRKASDSEEPPSKQHKATPSSAKALFEKIANKSTSDAQGSQTQASAKPNPFSAKTSSSSALARSILANSKSLGAQGGAPGGNNIFGYLSDASSAKNSGVEADAESESESDSEGASPGDEPSVAASGTGETGSQVGTGLSVTKQLAPLTSGFGPGLSSNPDTRESTPGRSLFERVTKGNDGQPVRAEKAKEPFNDKPAPPRDQTWNPSTTPIKFASSTPSVQKPPIFGQGNATAASSIFAPKPSFGSSNQGSTGRDVASDKASSVAAGADDGGKEGCESDKENESQPSKISPLDPKVSAAQPSLGSSLFQPKPASTEAGQDSEGSKKSTSLFGTAAKSDSKPEAAPATTNVFGALAKSSGMVSGSSPAASLSNPFGVNAAQPDKTAQSEAPKAGGALFGGTSTAPALGNTGAATSMFGPIKPASNPASGSGSGASTPSAPVFGAPSAQPTAPAVAKTSDAAPSTTGTSSQPQFSFGSASNASTSPATEAAPPKPLFGAAPKSPSDAPVGAGMFGGSPMKQDEPSPAKVLTGGTDAESSAPIFNFGNPQAAAGGATGSMFGAAPASATSNAASGIFGGGATSTVSPGSFNFSFGGQGASGPAFNNPFAKTSNSTLETTPDTGFNFRGASAGPAGGLPAFQFGAGSSANGPAAATSGAPVFGGGLAGGGGPIFNFLGPPSQPSSGSGVMSGSSQAGPGLQPPTGGSSTTGASKSSFPHRKIAPLKRRV